MDLWFQERDNDTLMYSYKVNNVLYSGRSEFQSIEVVETAAYGKMLVIDGLVMLTESDEFVYHEMIAHMPLVRMNSARHVLVIGGGDGGTVREILKHKHIESVTLCEIDAQVIDVSKQFFPGVAGDLASDRVIIKVGDGVAYLNNAAPKSFDLVVVDSTDPIGPGEGLFTEEFYRSIARALTDNGMMVCQSESPWYDAKMLRSIYNNIAGAFTSCHPYVGSVPTYPRGLWSWTLAHNHQTRGLPGVNQGHWSSIANKTRYLSKGMIDGAFHLPKFYQDKLESEVFDG